MVRCAQPLRQPRRVIRLGGGLLLVAMGCVSIDERQLQVPVGGDGSAGPDGAGQPTNDGSVDRIATDGGGGQGTGGSSAGGGGSSGSGGSTGEAGKDAQGNTCVVPVVVILDVIDDMEDGDRQIRKKHGRNGYWWVSQDENAGSGTVVSVGPNSPVVLQADGGLGNADPDAAVGEASSGVEGGAPNLGAVNFAGYGFSGSEHWAATGFGFANALSDGASTRNQPTPYDASAYGGIRFSARGTGRISVRMLTVSTQAPEFGGTCRGADGNGAGCGDFGVDIDLHGDGAWHSYDVPFCRLLQPTWATERKTFSPAELLGAMFSPGGMNELIASGWDLWLDNVAFYAPTQGDAGAPRRNLTWTDGWVDVTTNDLGVQGSWFTYTDGNGSTIGPTQFTGSGPICVSGETAPLGTGRSDAGDAGSSGAWGAAVRINLNQDASGELHPYDAEAHGVNGVRYRVTGMVGRDLPTDLRVLFKGFEDSGVYCADTHVTNESVTVPFRAAHRDCYDGDAGAPPNGNNLESIDFQVVGTTSRKTYGFCISEVGLTATGD